MNIYTDLCSRPMKGFQPALTQICSTVEPRTDYVFKVMDIKVIVTENIFQKCISVIPPSCERDSL